MKIKTQEFDNVEMVQLQGELDAEFSETLESTIKEIVNHHKDRIVLDMSKIGFIDSSGLEKLLWVRDYCNENACQLRLAGLQENCRKILEITRLAKNFDIYTELAEAFKSFA